MATSPPRRSLPFVPFVVINFACDGESVCGGAFERRVDYASFSFVAGSFSVLHQRARSMADFASGARQELDSDVVYMVLLRVEVVDWPSVRLLVD